MYTPKSLEHTPLNASSLYQNFSWYCGYQLVMWHPSRLECNKDTVTCRCYFPPLAYVHHTTVALSTALIILDMGIYQPRRIVQQP